MKNTKKRGPSRDFVLALLGVAAILWIAGNFRPIHSPKGDVGENDSPQVLEQAEMPASENLAEEAEPVVSPSRQTADFADFEGQISSTFVPRSEPSTNSVSVSNP